MKTEEEEEEEEEEEDSVGMSQRVLGSIPSPPVGVLERAESNGLLSER